MSSKPLFRLMVITDRKLCGEKELSGIIRSCVKSGVRAFQLREKDLSSAVILKTAKQLRKIINRRNSYFLINDKLDIVLLSEADGIHVPVNGLNPPDIRKHSKQMLIGKSVHSIAQAKDAQANGFDYVLFGPIYRTPAKVKYGKPQGISTLEKVCRSVSIPVFAVGGINPERAKKCIDAGAWGVAVIGAIMKSKNVARTVNEFKTALGEL